MSCRTRSFHSWRPLAKRQIAAPLPGAKGTSLPSGSVIGSCFPLVPLFAYPPELAAGERRHLFRLHTPVPGGMPLLAQIRVPIHQIVTFRRPPHPPPSCTKIALGTIGFVNKTAALTREDGMAQTCLWNGGHQRTRLLRSTECPG